MNKVLIFSFLALLVGAGVFYLYSDTEDYFSEAPEDSYITGYIINITKEAQSFLVAEGLKAEEYTGDIEELEGNAIYLALTEETEIIKEDIEVSLDDLAVGDKVEVWTTGIILESYPARGTALKVVVLEEEEKDEEEISEKEEKDNNKDTQETEKKDAVKECYVGGCSGELCTDNPEAISTCELIAGMECLREEMTCKLVEEKCTWVLSKEAAECFMGVEEEYGEKVRETRIGYFFEKAEELLN